MKTTLTAIRVRARGTALVVALMILAVAGILLGSYLYLVQYQSSSVWRSQSWNTAMPVAEAGLDEALAMMNNGGAFAGSGFILNSAYGWTNLTGNWTSWSGNPPVTSISNNVTTPSNNVVVGSYTVYITNNPGPNTPDIASVAFVDYTQIPWVFQSSRSTIPNTASAPPYFLAAFGSSTPATTLLARKVWVHTKLVPLFALALAAKKSLTLVGNGTVVDSYNSTNTTNCTVVQAPAPWTNYTINVYNSAHADSDGNIGIANSDPNNVSVGNGNIDGYLYTTRGWTATSWQEVKYP
jgi:Tfp pilus assembly protein PilX